MGLTCTPTHALLTGSLQLPNQCTALPAGLCLMKRATAAATTECMCTSAKHNTSSGLASCASPAASFTSRPRRCWSGGFPGGQLLLLVVPHLEVVGHGAQLVGGCFEQGHPRRHLLLQVIHLLLQLLLILGVRFCRAVTVSTSVTWW